MGAGVVVSAIGILAVIRVVLGRLLNPEAVQPGWTSLTAITLLLGGIQLFCIGLVGQYVSRIFEETKKRPLYLVREKIWNSDGEEESLVSPSQGKWSA
jgi:glucosyltransferase